MAQKALIVDDHIDFIQSIQLVAEMAGYQVVAVSSAREALDKLDESFDILVTDLMMPEIDGFALINKALEINPKLKTLVVSASLELAKERYAESAGFDLVEY
jgi:two-component system NtrC family response regulator